MPMKTVRFWIAWPGARLLLLLSFLPSCSEPGGGNTEPSLPSVWSVESQPQATIGQLSGDAPYLFSRMGPAVLLPDGRIVVSDNGDPVIRVFRPDGSFDHEFGGRGEGPGEFANIFRIVVVPPDTLVIHDPRLLRLTTYSASGTLLSTLPLRAEGGRPEVYLGKFSTGELGFSWIRAAQRDMGQVSPDMMDFGRFDPSGHLTGILGSETGMRRKGSPVAFSPHLYADLIGDSIVLTNGILPEVQVWDADGTSVRSIPIPVPEVDESSAWQELEEELLIRNNQMELSALQRDPREEGVPAIGMMLVDDQDRVWVKAFNPRTDNHLLFGDRGLGGSGT